jgi:N-hydroxyarylamine O-acetyltransferase
VGRDVVDTEPPAWRRGTSIAASAMSADFDLDAYLRRIGYSGPRAANLATLMAVNALQPAAIPFENLDPLLGRLVPLDLASLQAKLVQQRRGGYCFELNSLLVAALEVMGFPVVRLAARVRWRVPPESPERARTHTLLRVDLAGGPYLVDVGFGGRLFAAPLRLDREDEQQIAADVLRLRRADHLYTVQARAGLEWEDLYRFTLEPQAAIDYEVANWFTSTYPSSFFRSNLLAERLEPGSRFSLFNARLTRTDASGAADVRFLAGARELGDVLETDFNLELPVDPDVIWARIPRSGDDRLA